MKNKIKKFYLLKKIFNKYTFLLFLLFSNLYGTNTVVEKNNALKNLVLIPTDDLSEIKILFEYLFRNGEFSYSLFGDKPMCISTEILYKHSSNELVQLLSLKDYCLDIFEPYSENSDNFIKRWGIWEKYKEDFKIKNYLFFSRQLGGVKRVFIINKKSFVNIVSKNIDVFNSITNKNLIPESLLAKIEIDEGDFFKLIGNNEGLLGILLGFGRHNSMLFQQREELAYSLKRGEIIDQELEAINKNLDSLYPHDGYIISTINRVGFVGDPDHSETIFLREKYTRLNIKINEIYSTEDWFEKTLIQLTAE